MAGGKFSLANLFGITIRESANDGSDFTNPDADYRRLFLGEDAQLHVKDSAGAVTDIGGGLSDPMTTRGDVIVRNASNVTARLPIGSTGKVLSSDGTDVSWQTPSGGGYNGTLTEATLSADVTLVTPETFYDGPTTTPAAGTYDVWARISYGDIGSSANDYCGRLIANGGTVYDEAEIDTATSNTFQHQLYLSARITADGTNPVKIMASSGLANYKMKRDPANNSSALHRATLLVLTKVS